MQRQHLEIDSQDFLKELKKEAFVKLEGYVNKAAPYIPIEDSEITNVKKTIKKNMTPEILRKKVPATARKQELENAASEIEQEKVDLSQKEQEKLEQSQREQEMLKDKQSKDEPKSLNVCIYDFNLGAIDEGKQSMKKELENDADFLRLKVQAKFLRGDLNYTDSELESLKSWLRTTDISLMRRFFKKQILQRYHDNLSSYPHSPIAKLFKMLKIV